MPFLRFSLSFLPVFLTSLSLLTPVSAHDLLDVLVGYNLQNHPYLGFSFNQNGSDFNMMANMLLVSGLAEMEIDQQQNGCTLFVPTDEAFFRTARDLGVTASSEVELYRGLFLFLSERYEDPISVLRQQIMFHILPQKLRIFPHDLSNGLETEELDVILQARGIYRINMTLIDPNPDLPDPNVIYELSNVEVSNCYLHVIDRMLFFEPVILNVTSGNPTEASMIPEPTTEAEVESSYAAESNSEEEASREAEASSEPITIPSESITPSTPPTITAGTKTPEPSYFPNSPPETKESVSKMPSPSWSATSPQTMEHVPVESFEAEGEEEYYITTGPEASLSSTLKNQPRPLDNDAEEPDSAPSSIPESSYTPTPNTMVDTILTTGQPSPNQNTIDSSPEASAAPYVEEEQKALGQLDSSYPSPPAVSSQDVIFEEGPIDLQSRSPGAQPSEQLSFFNGDGADNFSEVEESAEPSLIPDAEITTLEPTAESEEGECFPLSANFHLPGGEAVPFAQLDAGFDILATESNTSQVYLFTHRQTTGRHDFVRIQSNKNHSISLSQGHYVYANGELKAAGHVQVGDTLQTLDGRAVVKSVAWTTDYGLIAPHTLHGDIVVNRVVVSTYTSAVNPKLAHALLWPLRFLVKVGVAKEPLGSVLYNGLPQFIPATARVLSICRGHVA